ncbi:MAG TPA: hypothetical protein VFC19_21580 [Candidatus Limnocylindrales bacterium]|nr:hypothetical protein [Candidatus Limnocylindrales bacterium]
MIDYDAGVFAMPQFTPFAVIFVAVVCAATYFFYFRNRKAFIPQEPAQRTAVQYTRLHQLVPTPRQNIDALGDKPFGIFRGDRRSWEDAMRNGTLVLCAVVQANQVLYDPDNQDSAPAVVLYTTDPARAIDGQWLQNLAMQVRSIKQDSYPRSAELKEIQNLLLDELSHFKITLPNELTGGVPVTMMVAVQIPGRLPGGCIPVHSLIPGMVGRDGQLWHLKPQAYL